MSTEQGRRSPRQVIRAAGSSLPEGTVPVGISLVVLGITSYLFLIWTGRALGPVRYGSLSILWIMIFLVIPGLFLPIEQEVSRTLAHRRAQGVGGGPVIKRAMMTGIGLVVVILLASSLASPVLVEKLFDDQKLLLYAFMLSLVAYSAVFLLRGVLSGSSRFNSYGYLLSIDGLVRLGGAFAISFLGVHTAGPFGMLIGLAPLVAIAFVLVRERRLVTPGPEAPWRELSGALGILLIGSVLAQVLVNAAPIVVKVLASESEQAVAGHFVAGLVISRVPLFLFQAVQAALLPKLTGLVAAGRHFDFRVILTRLLYIILLIGLVATVGAYLVGPQVLRLLFGSKFDLGHRDLAILTAANIIYMAALMLSQALISLSAHKYSAFGWFCGVVGFGVTTALGSALLLRVEIGLLVGAIVAVTTMTVFLIVVLRATTPSEADLAEAALLTSHSAIEV